MVVAIRVATASATGLTTTGVCTSRATVAVTVVDGDLLGTVVTWTPILRKSRRLYLYVGMGY